MREADHGCQRSWRREAVFPVGGLHGPLEFIEEGFGTDKGGVQLDGVGELVDVFEDFVEVLKICYALAATVLLS